MHLQHMNAFCIFFLSVSISFSSSIYDESSKTRFLVNAKKKKHLKTIFKWINCDCIHRTEIQSRLSRQFQFDEKNKKNFILCIKNKLFAFRRHRKPAKQSVVILFQFLNQPFIICLVKFTLHLLFDLEFLCARHSISF